MSLVYLLFQDSARGGELPRQDHFSSFTVLTVEEVTATQSVAPFLHLKWQWFWSIPYTALQTKRFVAISLAEYFGH